MKELQHHRNRGPAMLLKEIIARTRDYERLDGVSPAEALLSVLIDLFTRPDGREAIDPGTVQQAWEKLTRDLSVPEWLTESQTLSDGIDVLAANLMEAARHDLATALRAVSQPCFEGAMHSPDIAFDRLHELDDVPQPGADSRLWVSRPV